MIKDNVHGAGPIDECNALIYLNIPSDEAMNNPRRRWTKRAARMGKNHEYDTNMTFCEKKWGNQDLF
jgi:hypothetical protein